MSSTPETSVPPVAADAGRSSRLTSLDGLRGVAALVVLVHHALLTSAPLAEPYRNPGSGEGVAWLLTYTPLHLAWAGTEAVIVFFVLSGFVLTLPFLKAQRPAWVGYYAQRLPRLYLPVWAAIVLAAGLALSVDRQDVASASWWLNGHDGVGPGNVARSSVLVAGGISFSLNSALWSLRWEVIFSLLLPVFLLGGLLWRRMLAGKIMLVLAAAAAGSYLNDGYLTYLPVFGAGVLMAVERDRMQAAAARLTSRAWAGVTCVAVGSLLAYWLLLGAFGEGLSEVAVALSVSARLAGATLIVFVFAYCRPVVAVADGRVCGWLGQRSFSLYLVHEPIVVSVAFVTGGRLGAVLLLGSLMSLVVAEVFFRLVERPSHSLARVAGRRVAAARPCARARLGSHRSQSRMAVSTTPPR